MNKQHVLLNYVCSAIDYIKVVDIPLLHGSISRQHAVIQFGKNGEPLLSDLGRFVYYYFITIEREKKIYTQTHKKKVRTELS